MCRWLAYQGEAIYMDELVYEPEHSLVNQSLDARKAVTRVNADGFGLGWYTERDTPGQFHEVLPAWNDQNLLALTHHIKSRRFMAHVRSSTGTQVSRSNCHPFIHNNWMFLHNGQIGGFESIRFKLERKLSEPIYLLKKGSTDSELIFLLMLQNGLEVEPIEAIRKTISDINELMCEKPITDPFKASICISNGDEFWVVRYSSDNQPPTVFVARQANNLIFASEPLDKRCCWESIPSQSILHVSGVNITQHLLA
ncbi:class II glutamine amidotransferase [Vibrio hannami]|uniref:class II glutamine amidotransferase n=1 Tax=Vibrio hannami TaxID=2717094 RepID=UPI00240ED0BF|nr:class II glutamine amidotransferase [Vibrio hannami]MDG3086540.1 class II glutamine amidotransferase [Vibrio hannami]